MADAGSWNRTAVNCAPHALAGVQQRALIPEWVPSDFSINTPRQIGVKVGTKSPDHLESTTIMKTEIIHFQSVFLLTLLAVFMTGCATRALWKQTATREWKPQPPDQVLLVTDSNHHRDVVIAFRQFATYGRTGESRVAGWCVSRPQCEVALSHEAIRELTNSVCQYQRIPVYFEGHAPLDAASLSNGYAVWQAMEQQLIIHAPGAPAGPFTLPTSHQERQTALRAGMLPFAVTADAAIVGAALFAVGMSGYVGP